MVQSAIQNHIVFLMWQARTLSLTARLSSKMADLQVVSDSPGSQASSEADGKAPELMVTTLHSLTHSRK